MVVYEVNLEFDVAIAAPYREWLAAHVQELLALPGFMSAQVHDVVDPLPTAGRQGLCVRYIVSDLGALETYQREHAPRLRADGLVALRRGRRALSPPHPAGRDALTSRSLRQAHLQPRGALRIGGRQQRLHQRRAVLRRHALREHGQVRAFGIVHATQHAQHRRVLRLRQLRKQGVEFRIVATDRRAEQPAALRDRIERVELRAQGRLFLRRAVREGLHGTFDRFEGNRIQRAPCGVAFAQAHLRASRGCASHCAARWVKSRRCVGENASHNAAWSRSSGCNGAGTRAIIDVVAAGSVMLPGIGSGVARGGATNIGAGSARTAAGTTAFAGVAGAEASAAGCTASVAAYQAKNGN